jgi:hypothetical protein
MRWLCALAFMILGSGFALGACSSSTGSEALCNPGDNIFCRCRGGEAGTKQCREDGQGFGACGTPGGPCEESFGSGSSSSSGQGGGGTGGKKLLEACDAGDDCQSGLCRMGYCTQDCAKWQECTDEEQQIYGDCVNVDNLVQQCVPYCLSQEECEESFGEQSSCSHAVAVDAVGVSVCADWVDIVLPADGTECVDDWDCHLGLAEQQRVCEFEACLGGCHEDDDCPMDQTCATGAPGSCM